MPYFNLLIVDQQKTLSSAAQDRIDALTIFGKELGIKFTFEGNAANAPNYLLDEWWIGPHWVNPTIPIYVMQT